MATRSTLGTTTGTRSKDQVNGSRPDHQEEHRSQVQSQLESIPGSRAQPPAPLPPLEYSNMALNGPPQSPRSLSNAASALRRSAAIRQDLSKPVATQTNDGLPTDYGTNSSRGSGRMSAASMHKTASGGGDTVSSQDSTPWTEARTRTQTGSSIGSQDLTPRQYSGPGRVLQERHGSFENVKGAPLHQPPVLMPRLPIGASYQHDYTSSLSPRGTRQQSRDGNIVETDYRSDVEALDARAEIERDEDDDSSDSHGWSGVEDNYTSTPMKSPLLTQMLGNITPNQAFTPAFSSDNATRANDSTRFESDLTTPGPDTHTFINSDSGTLARVVAADQHAVPASHTPTHSTVAHEKNQHQDIGPAAPTSLSTSTPSGPMSPSQVGKALDWDEKASSRPATPQISTYTPGRPSLGTPPPSGSPNGFGTPDRATTLRDERPDTSPSPDVVISKPVIAHQDLSRHSSGIPASNMSNTTNSLAPAIPLVQRSPSSASSRESREEVANSSSDSLAPSPLSSARAREPSPTVSPRRARNNLPPPPQKSAKRTSRLLTPSADSSPAVVSSPTLPPVTPASQKPEIQAAEGGVITSASRSPAPQSSTSPASASIQDLDSSAGSTSASGSFPENSLTSRPNSKVETGPSASDLASILSVDSSLTTPNTPLSATDFINDYAAFGRSGSVGSSLISSSRPNSTHWRASVVAGEPRPLDVEGMSTIPDDEDKGRGDPYFSQSALARSDSMRLMATLSAQLTAETEKNGEAAQSESGLQNVLPRHIREPSEMQGEVGHAADYTSHDYHRPTLNGAGDRSLATLSTTGLPPPASPPLESPRSRADAKARAAAFVADLKRAREAASVSVVSKVTDPASIEQPFFSPRETLAGSPMISSASPKSEAEEPMTTTANLQPTSPVGSPILPPLPPRPSSASSSVAASPRPDVHETSSTRANDQAALSRRIAEAELPALPPPSPAQEAAIERRKRLRRRRPLPLSLQIAADLHTCLGPGDRAQVYAIKMKALRLEISGLNDWVAAIRDTMPADGRNDLYAASPTNNRREASSASFPSRGDGYRAKEITGTYSSRDLNSISVPFPGVLNISAGHANSSHTGPPPSRLSGSKSPPSALNNVKPSFFSGLGRRSSKRVSSSNGSGGSTLGPISPPMMSGTPGTQGRPVISSPLGFVSSSTSSMSLSSLSSNSAAAAAAAGRPLGPRMPGAVSRASIDSALPLYPQAQQMSSYRSSALTNQDKFQSPTFSASGSSYQISAPLPSRASFSYGSTTPGASVSAGAGAGVGTGTGGNGGSATADKLDRLENILPTADRQALQLALDKAGGDEVLAVSVYLSDEVGSETGRDRGSAAVAVRKR